VTKGKRIGELAHVISRTKISGQRGKEKHGLWVSYKDLMRGKKWGEGG